QIPQCDAIEGRVECPRRSSEAEGHGPEARPVVEALREALSKEVQCPRRGMPCTETPYTASRERLGAQYRELFPPHRIAGDELEVAPRRAGDHSAIRTL